MTKDFTRHVVARSLQGKVKSINVEREGARTKIHNSTKGKQRSLQIQIRDQRQ